MRIETLGDRSMSLDERQWCMQKQARTRKGAPRRVRRGADLLANEAVRGFIQDHSAGEVALIFSERSAKEVFLDHLTGWCKNQRIRPLRPEC